MKQISKLLFFVLFFITASADEKKFWGVKGLDINNAIGSITIQHDDNSLNQSFENMVTVSYVPKQSMNIDAEKYPNGTLCLRLEELTAQTLASHSPISEKDNINTIVTGQQPHVDLIITLSKHFPLHYALLNTETGSITLSRIAAQIIQATTTSGSIFMDLDESSESVEAATTTGNIKIVNSGSFNTQAAFIKKGGTGSIYVKGDHYESPYVSKPQAVQKRTLTAITTNGKIEFD